MNIFRPQKPYIFCPPKQAWWFRPVLHFLSSRFLKKKFNVRQITVRGEEPLVRLVRDRHSVLVTPNHADHADPSLIIHVGRKHNIAFHFMAAREGFERSRLRRFILQHSGAFSVDRDGADMAAIKTALEILRDCRNPLVIFPEGEIYHHHEELDVLNDGVATILLRAADKLPDGKHAYAIPAAIRITHEPSVAHTFASRMDALERRITWKPKSTTEIVDRIYRLGGAMLSIKEEEFIGESQKGELVERIRNLQKFLVEQAEQKHGVALSRNSIPARIKAVRQLIRNQLTNPNRSITPEREKELYDDLDHIFIAQQLYSYPGQYLRQNPTIDRIAETILKLEEDILEQENYPAPRRAQVVFGEPICTREFLKSGNWNQKSGVQPMTELLRCRIQELMRSTDLSA